MFMGSPAQRAVPTLGITPFLLRNHACAKVGYEVGPSVRSTLSCDALKRTEDSELLHQPLYCLYPAFSPFFTLSLRVGKRVPRTLPVEAPIGDRLCGRQCVYSWEALLGKM